MVGNNHHRCSVSTKSMCTMSVPIYLLLYQKMEKGRAQEIIQTIYKYFFTAMYVDLVCESVCAFMNEQLMTDI